ncbi:MAG: restriction endonuclease [Chloroflexi bacterium]|nr:restriction endonuclease [Chloroflexota bacterium]
MANFSTTTMSAVAREEAKRRRQIEAAQKRQKQAQQKAAREAERARLLQNKLDKQRYLQGRTDETDELNQELEERVTALQTVLEHTLDINDTIDFDSLRVKESYQSIPIPHEILTAKLAPRRDEFTTKVKAPGLFENALGLKGRYQKEMQAAEEQYQAALRAYTQNDNERQKRLAELQAQEEAARKAFLQKVEQREREVSELEASYKARDGAAVLAYNSMVLERSDYPEDFPQQFRLAYAAEAQELVIEYELPGVGVIPGMTEYKYVKSKDAIEGKPRKAAEVRTLYQDIVAAVALRTVHEVYEADQGQHLSVVTFNGFVQTVDPATGKDIRPHLVSVRATREQFAEINLARVDKRACLRNLGAQVSPQPEALQPVKPVVEFEMVDKRFIEAGDVIGDLESRPNLMDLKPAEFETLVSNLFGKMGLETRLTRASRDGGVDVVAYDTRPVLGGKVVIQAKRYKNTVGVSALRDLYGTMMNEGANKGIIVATSSYGSDAYEFSKDKPIELIDGGGLLYLLEQVGVRARIVLPQE